MGGGWEHRERGTPRVGGGAPMMGEGVGDTLTRVLLVLLVLLVNSE